MLFTTGTAENLALAGALDNASNVLKELCHVLRTCSASSEDSGESKAADAPAVTPWQHWFGWRNSTSSPNGGQSKTTDSDASHTGGARRRNSVVQTAGDAENDMHDDVEVTLRYMVSSHAAASVVCFWVQIVVWYELPMLPTDVCFDAND